MTPTPDLLRFWRAAAASLREHRYSLRCHPEAVTRNSTPYSEPKFRRFPGSGAAYGRRPGSPSASRNFLCVLLIWALLICHGVMGFAHQVSPCDPCDPAEAPMTHHAAHQQQTEGDAGGHTDGASHDGSGHFGYYAIVFALFGAVILSLLLLFREPEAVRPLRVFRPLWPPIATHPSRGPTPILLQVFRL